MAGLGYRIWTPGEVITADNVQDFLQDQTVQVYDSSAARGTALTGYIAEGMISYLKDTNAVEVYNGSAWEEVGADPAIFTTGTAGQFLKSLGTAGVAWDSVPTPGSATPTTEGIVFGKTNDSTELDFGIVSLGYNAGRVSNENGSVFIGNSAGYAATSASGAIFIGEWAGISVTTGAYNTGVGHKSLSATTTGVQNTALGHSAAINTNASNRVAIGYSAGGNGMASGNTFVGASTNIGADCTGENNSILGYNAGSFTSGSNNVLLGYNASPSSNSVSNQITLGNSSISALRCQVTTISGLSDERDKKDITDLPVGLSFINELRPVKFTWNARVPEPITLPDGTVKEFSASDVRRNVPDIGFIAQDLVQAEDSLGGRDWLQLTLRDNPERLEATPGRLVPILVKAVQELSAKVEELEARLK